MSPEHFEGGERQSFGGHREGQCGRSLPEEARPGIGWDDLGRRAPHVRDIDEALELRLTPVGLDEALEVLPKAFGFDEALERSGLLDLRTHLACEDVIRGPMPGRCGSCRG